MSFHSFASYTMDVLKPPEELEYATCDMAEASIQTNAKQQGYAVARNKLYNDKKGELRRRTFRCAMGRSRWVSHVLTLSRRVSLLSKVSKKIFTITGSTSALDLAFKVWGSSRHSQNILCRYQPCHNRSHTWTTLPIFLTSTSQTPTSQPPIPSASEYSPSNPFPACTRSKVTSPLQALVTPTYPPQLAQSQTPAPTSP